MKSLQRLLREDLPAHITLANLVGFALTFLAVPVMARAIGPDGRGEAAAALAAFAIAPSIIGMGIPLELRRRSAAGTGDTTARTMRDLIAVMLLPALGLGALFVFTIYSGLDHQLKLLAFIGLLIAPLGVSWASDAARLAGEGRYRALALLRVAHPAMTLAIVVGALYLNALTVAAVLVASISATLFTAALGLLLNRVSLFGPRVSRMRLSRQGARFAGGVIAEAASSRLLQLLVLPVIGATEAGYFSIALSLALLPLAIGQAMAADYFRLAAKSDSEFAALQIAKLAMKQAVSVILPTGVAFISISIWLIPIVFGEEFAPSVPVLLVMAPGSIFLAISYVASMLLAASDRGGVMTALQITGLTVSTVLAIPFGIAWSALGAGFAVSLGYLTIFIGQLIVMKVPVSSVVPSLNGLKNGLKAFWPNAE